MEMAVNQFVDTLSLELKVTDDKIVLKTMQLVSTFRQRSVRTELDFF